MHATATRAAPGDHGASVGSGTVDSDLRRRLSRASRRNRLAALALVAPLLLFLFVTFILPIGLLLFQSVDNRQVGSVLPATVEALAGSAAGELPRDEAFSALASDLRDRPKEEVAEVAKRLNYVEPGFRTLLNRTMRDIDEVQPATAQAQLVSIDERWGQPATWDLIRRSSSSLTDFYLLKALDLTRDGDGAVGAAQDDAIYVAVILRTLATSASVTLLCLLIGYPLAYMLASSSERDARWLMMLVLLPFWTSLLVRTTAWLVLLQSNGVVNSALRWVGLVSDPLELVHNRLGVLIAMTHILLPFVVLPIHAVMKGISPAYWRAASSLGANPVRNFVHVYLPLTLPGVAAGGLLVFILALGYYITPALVGGPTDQMLSSFIAYFVNQSNWGMAAALSVVLLSIVAVFYVALVVAFAARQKEAAR
ncbi:ABC transporter permease [Aureimonas endophytica]|uniref:ABC transporter permease n=1 Tax=Aureimonas endophytica TaxID=2027858 RepID=A0A916ZK87_9HYPH|nr:ABC transporter permease [Aureimonas endophytica]GGE01926.1 ABC transporter permease [Aureimonas endophytica]